VKKRNKAQEEGKQSSKSRELNINDLPEFSNPFEEPNVRPDDRVLKSFSVFQEKLEAFRKERETKRAEAEEEEKWSKFTVIQKNKNDELLVANKRGEIVYRRPPKKADDDDFSLSDSDDDLQNFCDSENSIHSSTSESDIQKKNPENQNDNIEPSLPQIQENSNSNISNQGGKNIQEEGSSRISETLEKPDTPQSSIFTQESGKSLSLNEESEHSKVKEMTYQLKATLGIPDST